MPGCKSFTRMITLLVLLAVSPTLAPPATASPAPSATTQRLERLSHDPLIEPWQQGFFRRRLELLTSGAPMSTLGQPVLPAPASAQSGLPIWSQYVQTPEQAGHVAVYDPAGDRILIIGGETPAGLTSDVWALSMSTPRTWARIASGGPNPTPRMGQSVVLDSQHHRLVMFGGLDANGSYLDDLWVLNLDGSPAWQQIDTGDTRPGARTNHSAVYDDQGKQMIVFGGADGSFLPLDETWSLALNDTIRWSPLVAPGSAPTGRSSHLAAIDRVHHKMFISSGSTGSSYEYQVYIWTLSLGTSPSWSQTTPTSYSGPSGTGYRAVYDPVNDALLAYYPGYSGLYSYSFASNTGWTGYTPPTQPFDIVYAFGMVLDPGRGLAVIVGGHTSSSTDYRCDAWGLSLNGYASWTELYRLPYPRVNQAAAFDPVRHRMLVFGGDVRSTGYPSNEVWALSLSNPPAWSSIQPSGTLPQPRSNASMTYDPVNDRMIVFGGYNSSLYTNEVWALSLSGAPAWTRLHPTGGLPHERAGHAVAYDPTAHRLFVFGGASSSSQLADLWTLSLDGSTSWRQLAPLGPAPMARSEAAMVYDDVAGRMLLIGGSQQYYSQSPTTGEVWTFDPGVTTATWSELTSGVGLQNSTGGDCSAIFDPVGHRVLRLSRSAGYYYYGPDTLKTYAFTPSGDTLWHEVVTGGPLPPMTTGESIVYDIVQNRILAFGGTANGNYYPTSETWGLSLGTLPLDVPAPGRMNAHGVTLAAYPNPVRGTARLRITTPSDGLTSVVVVDISGRKVLERDLGNLPAGEHDLPLDVHTSIPPGVYFATCRWNGTTVGARIAVVQ